MVLKVMLGYCRKVVLVLKSDAQVGGTEACKHDLEQDGQQTTDVMQRLFRGYMRQCARGRGEGEVGGREREKGKRRGREGEREGEEA